MRPQRNALFFFFMFLALFLQSSLSFSQSRSPEFIVNLFLTVYGTERMAEILPFTSRAFREDLSPEMWLERSYKTLRMLDYIRLKGVIQSVEVMGNEATVVVASRIKTKAATTKQTEIYFLRYTDQGWQLLDLKVHDEMLLDVTATEVG
ncbi:MAG: hypothetical protein IH857_06285 [Deltaproteobacteria bacterium]|nr:hypothetical protein [Deltaproteobacteria bacterium]